MSILSLIYRTAGAWGAGKGSRLHPSEVDENFYDLEQAVNALADNPALPREISNITIAGNALTFHLSDASTIGPITIPVASFTWRGDWSPSTTYHANDLFKVPDGLYFVNRDFMSGGTFIPTLGTGVGGALPYASLVMPIPNRLRVSFFWPGKPGIGLPELSSSDDFAPMFTYLCTESAFLTTDNSGNTCFARLRDKASSTMTLPLFLNNASVGHIVFLTGSLTGTTVLDDDVQFAPEDLFEVGAPATIDDTATGLALAFICTIGELSSSS